MRLLPDGSLHAADLDIFFGSNFIITVEEEECPEIRGIIEQVRSGPGAQQRPDQIYYRIIDHVISASASGGGGGAWAQSSVSKKRVSRCTAQGLSGVSVGSCKIPNMKSRNSAN